MQRAIAELEGLIQARYPDATFHVARHPESHDTVLLKPVVDVGDRDDVMDVIIDRLGELQADEHLPIFVVPVRPPTRREAMRRAMRQAALTPAADLGGSRSGPCEYRWFDVARPACEAAR
jgi:hypothetical protein